jgi:hypothetical protein
MSSKHISLPTFESTFPRLIITARDLPRKRQPFHILLISMVLQLDPLSTFSEAEINAELQRWILAFGTGFGLEHAELRRFLVDEGYLVRDKAGSEYRVDPDGGPFSYDPGLRGIDLEALVGKARQEREARKRAHTNAD